jgi:hypothetical protein
MGCLDQAPDEINDIIFAYYGHLCIRIRSFTRPSTVFASTSAHDQVVTIVRPFVSK